jgi:hypothetical protein
MGELPSKAKAVLPWWHCTNRSNGAMVMLIILYRMLHEYIHIMVHWNLHEAAAISVPPLLLRERVLNT